MHVCTPNATHAPLVRAVLAAGKHVVCEKPLAVDPAEAAELTALAADGGRGGHRAVRLPLLPHGARGPGPGRRRHGPAPLRLLHGSYLQDWLTGREDDDWRVDPAVGGPSRAFADIGVHWCDLVEFVTGHRVTRLTARLLVAVPERGGRPVRTEDGAVVLFETDGGASGNLTVSQVSPGRKNRLWFSLDGEHEGLAFDQEAPETLWVGGRDATTLLARGTSAHPGASRYDRVPAGHPQGYQDCFDAFVADTYAALAGDAPDGLPTFTDGLRAAHLTAAVLESARTDRWVDVTPTTAAPAGATR